MIRWSVDGAPVDAGRFRYQELNFGQPSPGHVASVYSIRMHRAELLAAIATPYEAWIADQRAEDDRHDAWPLYFKELNYPPLEELARYPDYFLETLQAFLWQDLVKALSLGPEPGGVHWVVNSIDSVEFGGDEVEIGGRAYPATPLRK